MSNEHDDDCFLSGGDDGRFPCICMRATPSPAPSKEDEPWSDGPAYEYGVREDVTPSPAPSDTLRDEFIRLLDAADRYNGSHIANRQPEGRLQGNLTLAIRRAYRVLGIGRTNIGGSHD